MRGTVAKRIRRAVRADTPMMTEEQRKPIYRTAKEFYKKLRRIV